MVEEKGQLPCPLSFMQDGMIPRLLSLWFHFEDCHQGMVSEPPRDPFSDAKLATQKLFEMDWKCQYGLPLLYFTHYVRNIVEKMGSHGISRYESSRM